MIARRFGRVLAAAAVVAAGMAGAGPAVSSAAPAPSAAPVAPVEGVVDTWVVDGTPLFHGSWMHIDDVSCADTSASCLAVGWSSPGTDLARLPVAQVWNGTSWATITQPWADLTAAFTDVACVDDLTCVAILEVADSPSTYQLVLLDDGTWSTLGGAQSTLGFTENLSLDCVTVDSCLVVGQGETAAETYAATWDGVTVTDVSFGVADPDAFSVLQDVDCLTSDWCVAVGWASTGLTTTPLLVSWDGATWTPQAITGIDYEDGTLHAVACSSTTSCLAVGHGHRAGQLTPIAASYDGNAWTTDSPDPQWGDLYGVDCVAAGCYAVGSSDFSVAAGTWTPLSLPARSTDVDCDAHGCMTVGRAATGGRSYANLLASGAWTWLPLDNPTAASPWGAIGCSAAGCLVAGRAVTAGTVGYPTLSLVQDVWRAQPAYEVAGSPRILAVDCLADGRCVGVGDQRVDGHPAATVVRWSAERFQVPTTTVVAAQETRSFSDVDCPTSDACVAVGTRRANGGTQGFVRLVTPTAVSAIGFPTFAGLRLSGVACPTLATCRVSGTLRRDGSEQGFVATRVGASMWKFLLLGRARPHVDAVDIDCASDRRCVIVGSWADAAGATHPMVVELVRGDWRPAALPGGIAGTSFGAVDCEAGVCHVVGDNGSRLVALRTHSGLWLRDAVLSTVSVGTADPAGDWDVACTTATTCFVVGSGAQADVLRRL